MLNSYQEALEFLENRRPVDFNHTFAGQKSLNRVKKVLELLDNPQEKIKIIHIAGTSGKGSTAYFTSKILEVSGFKVGLTVSPSVFSLLERFQINSTNLGEEKFVEYLNQIIPFIEQVDKLKSGTLTFFDITTILAFYIFEKEKVDYAVVETGIGGLMDATNTVKNPNKIVILTNIDFDHTEILGKKISQIARQKAGVIFPGNTVFSALQKDPVAKVLNEKTEAVKAKLYIIREDLRGFSFYTRLKTNEFGTKFNFHYSGIWVNDIILSQIGNFQAQNCSLALAACLFLATRNGFEIDQETIKQALRQIQIPARNQKVKYQNKEFFVDLAHNPHKVESISALMQYLYPGFKFTVIFGALSHKDSRKMLKSVAKIAQTVILTKSETHSPASHNQSQTIVDLEAQTKTVKELAQTKILVKNSPKEAIDSALQENTNKVLVVGSSYLAKEVLKQILI